MRLIDTHLGTVLFNVLIAVSQPSLTLAVGRALLGIRVQWPKLPLLLAGMAIGTAGWVFFYAIFAFRIRRNDIFNSLNSVFYFAFMFARSMFYPLEPLPIWFRPARLLNPITWEIAWLRYTSIGIGNFHSILLQGAAFLIFSLACFALAVRCLKQQE